MTNLKGIPAQDDFETTLSSSWNGGTGTMNVFAVPDGTLPTGEFSYIVVEPGTNNMQVAKISGWDNVAKTFTVSSIDVEKSHGVNYTAKSHPANSVVRVSNNFAFWKEIQSAIASKVNITDLGIGTVLIMDEWTYEGLVPQANVLYACYEDLITKEIVVFHLNGIDYTLADIYHSDFKIKTVASGAYLAINFLTTEFTPNQNFTIECGGAKEGMQYIVRIKTGATPYTMTLGTGITNPFNEDLTLTANKITTLCFLATSHSTLELFVARTAE